MEATKETSEKESEARPMTISTSLYIRPLMGVFATDQGVDRHHAVDLYFASFLNKTERLIAAGVPGIRFLPNIDQEGRTLAVHSHTLIKVQSDTELAQALVRYNDCPTSDEEGYDEARETEVSRLLNRAVEKHLTSAFREVGFTFDLRAEDSGSSNLPWQADGE